MQGHQAVLSLFFFFFTNRFHTHKKHTKAQYAHKRTKIKKATFYAFEEHLRRKKSLIRLFAFLYFLYFLCFSYLCAFSWLRLRTFVLIARVKSFCKKKKQKRFKTALMTSFTLLLNLFYYKHEFFLITIFFNFFTIFFNYHNLLYYNFFYHNLFQLLHSFSIITIFFNYHNLF